MSESRRAIRGTVLCLPVVDLDRTLGFYRAVFDCPDAVIDEGIVTMELPGLSLFLMERSVFDSYAERAGLRTRLPAGDAGAIVSCAVETRNVLDTMRDEAARHGGTTPGEPRIDPAAGGYIGYVGDPDGHVWELVCTET